MSKTEFTGRVAFAVGTGRCGTHFIWRLLAGEPSVAAWHEHQRNRMNEAFHKYCQWHRLPVDHEGFLYTKEAEIREDLAQYQFWFESSPTLSLSIRELWDRFSAKFILLVRRPDEVVCPLWSKGWYDQPYAKADPEKALGYHKHQKDHHFLTRITPSGSKFETWNKMTRTGKIAWYWNAVNLAVLEQFGRYLRDNGV